MPLIGLSMRPTILILIPARYGSSRYPGKPLAMIAGKSMIEWVYAHAAAVQNAAWDVQVRVVTDDDRIATAVEKFGGKVCRVDDQVSTGTERIYLAYQRYFAGPAKHAGDNKIALIVNLQGDEPLLTAQDLKSLIEFGLTSRFPLATMVQKKEAGPEFYDINRVKVIYSPLDGACHYFSRAAIPAVRDGQIDFWYLHVGVYAFRPEALEKFCSAPKSYYEEREKLEQLRALENGISIGAVNITTPLHSVDCPADLAVVERSLSGTGK